MAKETEKQLLTRVEKSASLGLSRDDVAAIVFGYESWGSIAGHPYEEKIRKSYVVGKTKGLFNLLEVTEIRAMDCDRKDSSNNAQFLINRRDKAIERAEDYARDIVDDTAIKQSILDELKAQ